MKGKTLSLFSAAAALLFGLTSCMPENTPAAGSLGEETPISVSNSNLVFAQAGGSEQVTVEGAETWNFISSAGETGWLKVSQNGNVLSVTAETNTQGEDRNATILVMGKTSQAKINVTQTQADFVINFSDSEVVLPAIGGEKLVTVAANSQNWSFDPLPETVTWLTLTQGGGIVILNAQPNNAFEPREIGLTLTVGETEKRELTVRQMGAQKYFIPYEVPDIKNYNPMDIIRFEQNRGNLIVGFSEPQEVEAYFPGSGYWTFQPGVINVVTGSRTSNVLVYNYATLESAVTGYTDALVPVYYSDLEAKPERAEFVEYLTANGYTPEDESGKLYISESGKLKVAFDETQEGGLIAMYTPNFAQPEPYPTWETMPIGTIHDNLDFIRNPEVKAEDIKAMEAEAGSENIADQPNAIAYATGGTGLDEGYRFYFITTEADLGSIQGGEELLGSIMQYDLFFDNPNYALWKAGSKWQITEEFGALLEAEGWTFLGEVREFIQYYKDINEDLTTVMLLSPVEDPMVFEGQPGLRMSRIVYPNSAIGSFSSYTLREIFEGKAGNITEALMTPLQKGVWKLFEENNRKLFKK